MSREVPDWIDGFMELTENSEPPVLYRKWTAISTVAAALQRKVRFDFGLSFTVYPNLYIVLVGPSATGKGTSMRFAYDIIEQVPLIRLSAQATSLQALIRRMKENNLTDIDTVTGEQHFHSSLTIFSTEFTVFLGYQNKELISALCEWYDCQSRWSYETISRKREEVIGVWVNMLAGTTPDSLQSSLPVESIGAGLTSRIVFVYETKRAKLVILPTKSERELALQRSLVNDLESINALSGPVGYEDDFVDFYTQWCINAAKNPPFANDRKFDGYNGRRRELLLKLSMICCASRTDDMIMTLKDIERAANLLAEVEVNMGKVFKGMGKSDLAGLINDAIVYFSNSQTPDIPYWEFARHFEGDMDKWSMQRVLETLEASNIIKVIVRPGADSIIRIIQKPD